jgi:hypothetical protein
MKSATSLTPSNTGLSGTQFSTLNSAGINDPEGPEKYNNTEVKYVRDNFLQLPHGTLHLLL